VEKAQSVPKPLKVRAVRKLGIKGFWCITRTDSYTARASCVASRWRSNHPNTRPNEVVSRTYLPQPKPSAAAVAQRRTIACQEPRVDVLRPK
jgi:hypothetical protein